MATNSMAISNGVETKSFFQGAVVVLGRFFFALIFLVAAPNHFTRQTIAFSASQGVPWASIAVPLSGVLAIAGGLSILLGYRARIGASRADQRQRLACQIRFSDYSSRQGAPQASSGARQCRQNHGRSRNSDHRLGHGISRASSQALSTG